MWLGINRAVDWVAARADVDRARFVYEGTSQGGAGGLALGYLNTNFTRIAVYVPAMTDMLASRHHRRASGWPKLVEYQCDDARRAAAEKSPGPRTPRAPFSAFSRPTCRKQIQRKCAVSEVTLPRILKGD